MPETREAVRARPKIGIGGIISGSGVGIAFRSLSAAPRTPRFATFSAHDRFLEGRGLSLEEVPITTGRDEQVSAEITDSALAEAFRRYHANLARLDLVKNTANLAQSARNRMRPSRIVLS
jgi:hypothetical protein